MSVLLYDNFKNNDVPSTKYTALPDVFYFSHSDCLDVLYKIMRTKFSHHPPKSWCPRFASMRLDCLLGKPALCESPYTVPSGFRILTTIISLVRYRAEEYPEIRLPWVEGWRLQPFAGYLNRPSDVQRSQPLTQCDLRGHPGGNLLLLTIFLRVYSIFMLLLKKKWAAYLGWGNLLRQKK